MDKSGMERLRHSALDAAVREAIQGSDESTSALARKFGINPKTVAKWRGRTSVQASPSGRPRKAARGVEPGEESAVQSPSSRRASSARKRQIADAQAIRSRILCCASELFVRYGYDRTTMSAIAGHLGGGRNTLWQHFRSKQEIMLAFFQMEIEAFDLRWLDKPRPISGKAEVLAHFVREYLEAICSERAVAIYRIVANAGSRLPRHLIVELDEAWARAQVRITQYLGPILRDEPSCTLPADQMVRLLLALCDGGLFQRVLIGASQPTDAVLEEEVAFVSRAFLAVQTGA